MLLHFEAEMAHVKSSYTRKVPVATPQLFLFRKFICKFAFCTTHWIKVSKQYIQVYEKIVVELI